MIIKKKLYNLLYLIFALIIGFAIQFFTSPETDFLSLFKTDDTKLKVHFLDVGQADCSIVELPGNKVMVIDAGNNDDGLFICDYISKLGIETIDFLVGTHPHEDHIGSLDTLLYNYSVGKVYMPPYHTESASYYDVLDAIEYTSTPLVDTMAGTSIYSDSDLSITAVAPVKDNYDSLNNASIVIRLTYKDSSFLFTGDAEEESEYDITHEISADVLSVGHHGSSTSTTDSFLNRVDPMYAVISCGVDNDYGHPHWETIEKLENDDIITYRTDKMGTIICSTNGNGANDYYWEKEND